MVPMVCFHCEKEIEGKPFGLNFPEPGPGGWGQLAIPFCSRKCCDEGRELAVKAVRLSRRLYAQEQTYGGVPDNTTLYLQSLQEAPTVIEPEKLKIKAGTLEIESGLVFLSPPMLDGKPLNGVRGITLEGKAGKPWVVKADIVPVASKHDDKPLL